ncbi:hypothetical protein [Paenibacillus sp. PK3_47]|uniref:hypothetical protein n=1 Tax=Paenibacillus sp. PK3_47 TaxID=2072642 RepID=UPI00201DB7B3|nr:hypothetical protein [Paenibacillus sp. PK3_47]
MRLSRTSRKRNSRRRYILPQLAGIVVISAYGISQITAPTYALLTSSVTEESGIASAFVFPSTVDRIADQASEAMNRAALQRDGVREALAGMADSIMDSDTAETLALGIEDAADQARGAAASAAELLARLESYASRSQQELAWQRDEINQRLSPSGISFEQLTAAQNNDNTTFENLLIQSNLTISEFQEMVRKLASIMRVDAYVQAAYQQALTASEQAGGYAEEAAGLYGQAADTLLKLKAAEAKAKLEAEEKAKLEAEEKAKLEAEEKAKLEAEEKAKLEAEEKAKLEAEEKAKLEAEKKAKLEAEEKAKLEAEEKAKLEAEEKTQPDVQLPAEPDVPAADNNAEGISVKIGQQQNVF